VPIAKHRHSPPPPRHEKQRADHELARAEAELASLREQLIAAQGKQAECAAALESTQ
jgi:hypothetical protein